LLIKEKRDGEVYRLIHAKLHKTNGMSLILYLKYDVHKILRH